MGIWYADRYDAPTRAIPNSVGTPAELSTNLIRASRRMFSTPGQWACVPVAVDDAAIAPDGTMEASTLSAPGDWFVEFPNEIAVPNGTYTLAISAKRNVGTDQSFKIGDFTGHISETKIATSVWQEFSHTFDVTSGVLRPILISPDRATGVELQVCDFRLYAGAVDLGPGGFDGNMYLGRSAYDAPPVAGNAVNLSTNEVGYIQMPAATDVTNFTALAVVSKVTAGAAYQAFLSKVQSFGDFSALTEVNTGPAVLAGGQAVSTAGGLWPLLNDGYHVIGHRYDGTHLQIWIDDMQWLSRTKPDAAAALRDFYVGNVNGLISGGLKFNSVALYPRSLSDVEYRTAVTALSQKAVANGLTMSAVARALVVEGDSITAADPSYATLFGPNANPKVFGSVYAVGGNTITELQARAASIDALIPPVPGTRKFLLSVLLHNGVPMGSFLADLAAYCDARRARGYTVIVCTVLPSTSAGFNAARNAANAEIRLWATNGSVVPGKHADYICDFAADATIGPDDAASNTTYYSDGTHPTPACQAIMEPVYRAVINAI